MDKRNTSIFFTQLVRYSYQDSHKARAHSLQSGTSTKSSTANYMHYVIQLCDYVLKKSNRRGFLTLGLLLTYLCATQAQTKFTDITEQAGIDHQFAVKDGFLGGGACVFDCNNDGFQDFYLTGGKQPDRLYLNQKDGTFKNILAGSGLEITKDFVTQGVAGADVNRDGFVDLFITTNTTMDTNQVIPRAINLFFLNNGDNTFTNATASAGLEYTHNTFMGVFIDIDNDTWLDLIVAHDTGEIRTYKNKGDGTFEMKDNPSTNMYGYPMGIAVGDYNNDGLVDFMFSNTGSTVPVFMASGDIEDKSKFSSDWYFYENQGGFVFKDVGEKTLTKDYEFSWGAVFADMNNDGLQELIVAENYVEFPPHKLFKLPGRFLVQKEDHTFASTEDISGVENPNYGITPLVSDFNQDGYLDMVWVNLGSPISAYINEGGDNNFLKVTLADNATDLGAKVQVVTASGKELTEFYVVGEGLTSDQSNILHFGLGKEKAKSVTVNYISGKTYVVNSPKINSLIDIPSIIASDTIAVEAIN